MNNLSNIDASNSSGQHLAATARGGADLNSATSDAIDAVAKVIITDIHAVTKSSFGPLVSEDEKVFFENSHSISSIEKALSLAPEPKQWRYIFERARVEILSGQYSEAVSTLARTNAVSHKLGIARAVAFEGSKELIAAHNQYEKLLNNSQQCVTRDVLSISMKRVRNTLKAMHTGKIEELELLIKDETPLTLFKGGTSNDFFYLGKCYEYGIGVERNDAKAVDLYIKSAAQKNAEALRVLIVKAEGGNALAQLYLSISYSEGDGVDQNDAEAFKWAKESADQGNAAAEYMVAFAYEYGRGVDEDPDEALKWIKKSANQGFNMALESLERRLEWLIQSSTAKATGSGCSSSTNESTIDAQNSSAHSPSASTNNDVFATDETKWYYGHAGWSKVSCGFFDHDPDAD